MLHARGHPPGRLSTMKIHKILTIAAALASLVANVWLSSKVSAFVYMRFVFHGDDRRDLTPGDGLGMMGLWTIVLFLGWLGLFLIWRVVYRRISKA